MEILLIILIVVTLLWFFAKPVAACTAVYVGAKVSDNGHTYFGRTEDVNASTKRFVVYEHATHDENEYYSDTRGDNFKMPMPKETLRFSVLEDSKLNGEGEYPYGEAGFNELGVSLSATVTSFYNEAAKAADPATEGGINEVVIAHILLGKATSARNGIEYLAEIMAKYGASEQFLIFIADEKEVWAFETVSGHEWAAIKMPDDKVSVIPNHLVIGKIDVNDSDNYLASPNLISLAKEHGFLVEEDGLINVMKTYGPVFGPYDSYRAWAGRKFLNPDLDVHETDPYYEMLFSPKNKVSMMDIRNLLSIRYEDQPYSQNKAYTQENYMIRPIGVQRQAEVHIFELDQPISTQWQCMGPIEFSVSVPFYTRLMTSTPANMQYYDTKPIDGQYDWSFRKLATLCALNREMYGKNVRLYWDKYQEALIDANKDVVAKINELYKVDSKAAETKATDLAFKIAKEAQSRAETLFSELMYYLTAEECDILTAIHKHEAVKPFMPSLLEKDIYTNYSFDM